MRGDAVSDQPVGRGRIDVDPVAGREQPLDRAGETDAGDRLIAQGRAADLAKVPDYQCRFHWKQDSVAFWDNRSTQHYAVMDYPPCHRKMERAGIIGDKPY